MAGPFLLFFLTTDSDTIKMSLFFIHSNKTKQKRFKKIHLKKQDVSCELRKTLFCNNRADWRMSYQVFFRNVISQF